MPVFERRATVCGGWYWRPKVRCKAVLKWVIVRTEAICQIHCDFIYSPIILAP